MKIEIWSDIACPWCYIGKRRFEAALATFPHQDKVEVLWRSYQLDPSLPPHYDGTEAEYLSERKGLPVAQVRRMFEHVAEQAAAEGLSYDFDALVVANSFDAHQLLHLAARHGKAAELKERLLCAHFEHGEDIGDRAFLARTGAAAGLDAAHVVDALESGRYAESVRNDIEEARTLGITGVPFFVIDRKYGISGAQPSELFRQALDEAWQESHPLVMVPAANDDACGPDGCAV